MTPEPTSSTGVVALARLLGGLTWVAERLFVTEGQWADHLGADAAVVHLATHSRHHGWHAGLWRDALPDSPALDALSQVQSPAKGWSRAFDAAEALAPAPDAALLAALYRNLVPRYLVLVDDIIDSYNGPGDAHVARATRLVRADVVDDLVGGIACLHAAIADRDDIETAASTTQMLDQAFRTC